MPYVLGLTLFSHDVNTKVVEGMPMCVQAVLTAVDNEIHVIESRRTHISGCLLD